MPKTTNNDRHARMERVILLLQRQMDGLKELEIAKELHIERRVANNYLRDLENRGQVYKDGKLWYINDQKPIVLRRFELEAEEAMVLYLASRLFVKQSDKRNIMAENVLEKLATILSTDAGLGDDIAHAAQELTRRPMQEGYEDVFQTIMRGYLYRRRVRIVYHPYRGDKFETIIEPYLLEPSAIGFSTYVIGYSSIVDKLRTYKIERIIAAEVVRNSDYRIPNDFPGLSLLQNAWSIFYGDETIQVVLRFHPSVARRVQETNWHPSQHPIIGDPEKAGYVLMRFEVADTTDLKPWIRTWGANCEVLQPEALRDEMIGESRRYAELYGWEIGGGKMSREDRFNSIFGE
ncbi:MAG: WYL domain-containing protein [Anaerolineae bacterium]|nr:WYL domain-containing protein [Anaerolineae bacterium]